MYDNLKEKIEKIVAFSRPFSIKEQQFVARWKEEYKLRDDIILEAVRRAKKIKGEYVSFFYINGILEKWAQKGVKSETDILALDEEFKKNKKEVIPDNKKERVRVKLLSSTAKAPVFSTPFSAGADIYADVKEDTFIKYGKTIYIPTGISIAVPSGYAGLICSGVSEESGVIAVNNVSIMDTGFERELLIPVYSPEPFLDDGSETWDQYVDRHTIRHGDRIACLLIIKHFSAEFEIENG